MGALWWGSGADTRRSSRAEAAARPPQASAPLKIEAPSTAVAGEPFEIAISLEEGQSGMVQVECESDPGAELPEAQSLPAGEKRYRRLPVVLKKPGVHRLEARLQRNSGVRRLSNPIQVLAKKPVYKVLWGELHAHTLGNHTIHAAYKDLIGRYRADLDRAYEYAREVERLDFCALSNHYQDLGGLMALYRDVEVSPWDLTRQAVIENHEPGKFVTLLAYEWQGTEGDHNIFYKDDQGRINPFNRLRFVLDDLEKTEALMIPHQVSLPTRWMFHRPEVQRHVEISNRGRSAEFKMALPGLARGYQVGFVGASDDHTSHPGINSITAVLAEELTRDAIWDALKARRCYATNGEKILLDVKVDGHLPGETYAAVSAPRLEVSVAGTDRIREVHVVRNGETVHIHKGRSWEETFTFHDRDFVRSAMPRNSYHVRVIQGEGEIVRKLSQPRFVANNLYDEGAEWAWSSPVWVEVPEKLLRGWARESLAEDRAGQVADALAELAAAYEKARVDPERNHASQSFLGFKESHLGDPTILAAVYKDGKNTYHGARFNTLEQTPKWVPAGILDVTPKTYPAVSGRLRILWSSDELKRRAEALRGPVRSSGQGKKIGAHLDAAAHYLDFCRNYFAGLLYYHLARNSWLRGLAADSAVREWIQAARKSAEAAETSHQQWLSVCDTHCGDKIPFNFMRRSHLKQDAEPLLLDAFESLAKLQGRSTSQLLGMGHVFGDATPSHGLWVHSDGNSGGDGPAVPKKSSQSTGGVGGRLPERASADFHIDDTYVASMHQCTARYHELVSGLKGRHGTAFPKDYDPHRTAEIYIRVTYEHVGQGTLVLEYPGIGGKRLERQGPRLLGDAASKTHLFHLVDGDFASVDPAASHVRLTALGGPVTLRSVHFYSPAAARTEPSGRATGFTVEKRRSGEVHVRFRLDRQADLNLGIFNRGEVVAALAGGIHPPGIHKYSWSVDKQGAGEYKVRLQVGFSGLQFLSQNFQFGTPTPTWYSLSSPECNDFAP